MARNKDIFTRVSIVCVYEIIICVVIRILFGICDYET